MIVEEPSRLPMIKPFCVHSNRFSHLLSIKHVAETVLLHVMIVHTQTSLGQTVNLNISQPPAQSAAIAAPRTDENSRIAHEQLIAKAQLGGIDLYFLGDSITRRWGCTDPQWADLLANWRNNFFGWNAANFGWGADGIQHILWRIQNGELDEVNPKVIVILAGTNNLGNQPGGPGKLVDILKGFESLLAVCREKAPSSKIIVTAIFPRNDNLAVLPEIERINRELAKLADDQTIFYLDVNDKLASPEGILFEGMTVDNLHLSAKGYQVWADGLRPLLTEFLGPPAQSDHAPPPTGDPSLTRAEDKAFSP